MPWLTLPMAIARKVPIPDSDYVPPYGSRRTRGVGASERIQVTLVLRARHGVPALHDDERVAALLPHERGLQDRRRYSARHHAERDDVTRVTRFAEEHGLAVLGASRSRRGVIVAGSAAAVSKAFDVELVRYAHGGREHRAFVGPVHVPHELAGVVEAVLGLHDRPLAAPRPPAPTPREGVPLSAPELAALYGFPRAWDGRGETIGVIALGGGYRNEDVGALFTSLGAPLPRIVDVEVHAEHTGAVKGWNDPATPGEMRQLLEVLKGERQSCSERARFTFETTMDVELVAAFAPGARIVVYFAPGNDEQGLWSALSAALHDARHRPSVLSLSWGWAESVELSASHVSATVRALEELLRRAANLDLTVCAASGDDGAAYRSPDRRPCVQFPASSPHVLGCGGTRLEAAHGRIADEEVWRARYGGQPYASGGGVSRIFDRPSWQVGLRVPSPPDRSQGGRGVPDVAGVADRDAGCRIAVGGTLTSAAGTSAVAPLWAGLLARINQALGRRVGYLNPLLYRLARRRPGILRDVTEGGNGAYRASVGWDACTGLGTPRGEALLAALRGR